MVLCNSFFKDYASPLTDLRQRSPSAHSRVNYTSVIRENRMQRSYETADYILILFSK